MFYKLLGFAALVGAAAAYGAKKVWDSLDTAVDWDWDYDWPEDDYEDYDLPTNEPADTTYSAEHDVKVYNLIGHKYTYDKSTGTYKIVKPKENN